MAIDTRVGEFKIYDGANWDILYPKTTIANVANLSTTLADIQGDIDDLEATHIGKIGNVSLVTLSNAAAWAALPIGTMVMIASASVGKPSGFGYTYVIRGPNRDTSGGYSVMAIDSSTGKFASGRASTSGDLPTWVLASVQPDWNQATTTADDYIKNKPTIPSAYSLPLASTVRGGVKTGFSSSGLNRAVALSSEQMYVALPKATASQYGVAKISYSGGAMIIDIT